MNNLRISKKNPTVIQFSGIRDGKLKILEETGFHFRVETEDSSIIFIPKSLVNDERLKQ